MIIPFEKFDSILQECSLLCNLLLRDGDTMTASLQTGIVVNELQQTCDTIRQHPSYYTPPERQIDGVLLTFPDELQLESWPELLGHLQHAAQRVLNHFDEFYDNERIPLGVSIQLALVSDLLLFLDRIRNESPS